MPQSCAPPSRKWKSLITWLRGLGHFSLKGPAACYSKFRLRPSPQSMWAPPKALQYPHYSSLYMWHLFTLTSQEDSPYHMLTTLRCQLHPPRIGRMSECCREPLGGSRPGLGLVRQALAFPRLNSSTRGLLSRETPLGPPPHPRYAWTAKSLPPFPPSDGLGTGSLPTWPLRHPSPSGWALPKGPSLPLKDSRRRVRASLLTSPIA